MPHIVLCTHRINLARSVLFNAVFQNVCRAADGALPLQRTLEFILEEYNSILPTSNFFLLWYYDNVQT